MDSIHVYYIHTDNNVSKSCSPIKLPIQEEAGEIIYDEPHTSAKCTSPAPQLKDLTYYNYAAIIDQRARHDSGTSAMLLSPPSNDGP